MKTTPYERAKRIGIAVPELSENHSIKKCFSLKSFIVKVLIGLALIWVGLARYPAAAQVYGAEVEEVTLDPRVASMVCSSAAIIAEDEVLAGYFATIVSDPESIQYFLDLFTVGLSDGSVSTEDIADVVEACVTIRDDVEALE